jgi:eukaryotic-like serine/threonine-protein kinase
LDSPTMPGVILGTAAYMSPEQARGRKVDKRSDIWSFGVVLYEMLTGASPFVGETVSDSIGAILHKQIDLDALPKSTPPMLRHVLRRCLERDKKNRYRDIGDVRIELVHANDSDASSTPEHSPSKSHLLTLVMTIIALASLTALAGNWMLSRTSTAPAPLAYVTIEPAPNTKIIAIGDVSGPAVISHDGQSIVFTARDTDGLQMLWMRQLSTRQPVALRGTQGASFPFWSPDGRSVAFFADGKLKRHDLATRSTTIICPALGGRGGSWFENGTIVFAPSFQSGIFAVTATGGETKQITTLDTTRHSTHRWPSVIPGTDRFIYLAINHDPALSSEARLYMASLDGSFNKEILSTSSSAHVVDGHILFLLEDVLCTIKLNVQSGEIEGDPVPVIQGVPGDPTTWNSGFSVSTQGNLVYHTKSAEAIASATADPIAALGESTEAISVQRDGRTIATFAEGIQQNSLSISESGFSVAISGQPPASRSEFDIWIYKRLDESSTFESPGTIISPLPVPPPTQLTFMPGSEVNPVWSPDDSRIAFGRFSGNYPLGIWVTPVSGGNPTPLFKVNEGEPLAFPTDWTPDGRYIIFDLGSFIGNSPSKIYALPVDGGEPIPLVTYTQNQRYASVSPDGKWLVYTSLESGIPEIFVIPFTPGWEKEANQGSPVPDPNAKWRISLSGGTIARWGKEGNELYYISSSDSLIAVQWRTDNTSFIHDVGQPLFDVPFESNTDYDVQRNGIYFIFNTRSEIIGAPLHLVLNWQQAIK